MLHPTDYELAVNYFLEELAGDVTFIRASEPEQMPHLVSVLGIVVSKAVGGAWKWRMRWCRICVNTGSSTQRPSGWPDCLLLLF
jgi:hypothetical protein